MQVSCILILQTLKGYRVTCVEELDKFFWKPIDNEKYPIQDEERGLLTNGDLDVHFGQSELLADKKLAWRNAVILYRSSLNSGKLMIKDGIRFLQGYEERDY